MILGTAVAGGGLDPDAEAFLIASANDGDATISDAINDLVVALKDAGIWNKCTAIYPFVGGTADKHKWNLKDPRDLDAAFRLTWVATVAHDANGITPNGSSGYGDTKLNCSTAMTVNDSHIGVYSRTDVAHAGSEIGATASASSLIRIFCRLVNGLSTATLWSTTNGQSALAVANSLGMFLLTRRSSTDMEWYKGGSSIETITGAHTGTRPNLNLFIGAGNSGGSPGSFSPRNLAYVTIGLGLSDAEVSAYNTIVEAFQDALSRGVQ